MESTFLLVSSTIKMYTGVSLENCPIHYYWDFGEYDGRWRRYLVLSEFGYENGFSCVGGYNHVYRERSAADADLWEAFGKKKYLQDAQGWVDIIRYLVAARGIPVVGLYYKYPETQGGLDGQIVIGVEELDVETLLELERSTLLAVRGKQELDETTLAAQPNKNRAGVLANSTF